MPSLWLQCLSYGVDTRFYNTFANSSAASSFKKIDLAINFRVEGEGEGHGPPWLPCKACSSLNAAEFNNVQEWQLLGNSTRENYVGMLARRS